MSADGGAGQAAAPLSGQAVVLRSGAHLSRIASRLRDLEAILIQSAQSPDGDSADARRDRRLRMQTLDLMIQELTGLSDILIGTASHLPDMPDATVDALVDMPRLQSLSQALREEQGVALSAAIVIF
ncbi:MAG: hypothetical protein MUC82_15230 [Cypionkella sp.]|jgi:hypothetical protein|nr:hypothetical protein [Cypionkella sp.]